MLALFMRTCFMRSSSLSRRVSSCFLCVPQDSQPHWQPPQTILSTAVHSLRIDVVAGLTILHKPSVCLEFLEIFHRLLIHLRVVFVGTGSKINLRADNVIERFSLSPASLRASSELSTSYGREATSVTIFWVDAVL